MKARLLIIDDEAMVRDSMEAYLEDSGYSVVAVDSGRAGLEILETQSIDLILCDLRMPNLDGLQVLQSVKQRSDNIPVIVVSGAGVMDDVVQALRLGASDYLVKPIIDMVTLEHSVKRNHIDNRLYKTKINVIVITLNRLTENYVIVWMSYEVINKLDTKCK
jgi:sigma-B regulation protein RsbU (phosphoserine phosphatase)